MRKSIIYFLFAFLICSSSLSSKITWHTSYEEAVELAKSSSQPIFLFFTGSDWCTWCKKLEETLKSSDFSQTAENKYLFVKLDFPMKSRLDAKLEEQNQILQEKYSIRSFPSVIILDPEEQLMGITGYREGGGKQYASHLQKIVTEYEEYLK